MLGLFDLTTSIAHLANLVFTIHTMTPTLNAELLTTVDLSSGPLPLSLLVQLYCMERHRKFCHPLKPQMSVSSAKTSLQSIPTRIHCNWPALPVRNG